MRKQFEELLSELQKLDITQTEGDWAENLPEEIWEKHFKGNHKEVAHGLDIDTHRHYEVSTSVISIYEGFIGVTFITNMFSEMSSYEDCCVEMAFEEMEEVNVVSYKVINK